MRVCAARLDAIVKAGLPRAEHLVQLVAADDAEQRCRWGVCGCVYCVCMFVCPGACVFACWGLCAAACEFARWGPVHCVTSSCVGRHWCCCVIWVQRLPAGEVPAPAQRTALEHGALCKVCLQRAARRALGRPAQAHKHVLGRGAGGGSVDLLRPLARRSPACLVRRQLGPLRQLQQRAAPRAADAASQPLPRCPCCPLASSP